MRTFYPLHKSPCICIGFFLHFFQKKLHHFSGFYNFGKSFVIMKKSLRIVLLLFVVSAISVWAISNYGIGFYQIKADSIPSLEGRKIILKKYKKPKTGSFALFTHKGNRYVSRIIACENDTVEISGSKISVNEKPEKPEFELYRLIKTKAKSDSAPNVVYLSGDSSATFLKEKNYIPRKAKRPLLPKNINSRKTVVPDSHFFLLNDNRRDLNDSGKFGFIKQDSIIGIFED